MKKILSILLLFISIISISGCGTENIENEKIQIVTTIFPYYSFAKEICRDNADVTMLLKPGSESHTFDPTTQDILKIQNSDIFIYNGGESEDWVETILSSVDTTKTTVIKAIDLVDLIHGEHDSEEHNHAYDEHIWTSVKNSIKITEAISTKICETDINNADVYKRNTEEYILKLQELDKKFTVLINNSLSKTIIFADRFPFSYFAYDYNLNYTSAFPGCSEETEPSVQTMATIINAIKEQSISAVFYIEFSNQKIADTIQSETGADKLLFHSCHNVTTEEFNSGETYLSIMQQNLDNLKEALK